MKKGYNATDLLKMRCPDKPFHRAVHLIGIISQSAPLMKNKQFLSCINSFVNTSYKEMIPVDQERLYLSLQDLKHFKNDKLVQSIKRQYMSK